LRWTRLSGPAGQRRMKRMIPGGTCVVSSSRSSSTSWRRVVPASGRVTVTVASCPLGRRGWSMRREEYAGPPGLVQWSARERSDDGGTLRQDALRDARPGGCTRSSAPKRNLTVCAGARPGVAASVPGGTTLWADWGQPPSELPAGSPTVGRDLRGARDIDRREEPP